MISNKIASGFVPDKNKELDKVKKPHRKSAFMRPSDRPTGISKGDVEAIEKNKKESWKNRDAIDETKKKPVDLSSIKKEADEYVEEDIDPELAEEMAEFHNL